MAIHGAYISAAVYAYLHEHKDGQRVRPVGIMGGHAVSRKTPAYASLARLARRLSREGLLIVSGGGPGAMEAAHLGAYFVEADNKEVNSVLSEMAAADAGELRLPDHFLDDDDSVKGIPDSKACDSRFRWFVSAEKARSASTNPGRSLAVST